MGHKPGTYGLVRPRSIVDDDLLAETLRHHRLDQTSDDVDAAACRRSHDQLDDTGRRFLADREAMSSHEYRRRQQCFRHDTRHAIEPLYTSLTDQRSSR